jgi:glucose/arabinose dehydrogenase
MSPLRLTCCAATALTVAACGPQPIDPHRQIGPNPFLPEIHQYLFPPMKVEKITPWGAATPTVALGLQVKALAKDLKNPRSLYVLPNGDVLVVESDGPKPPAPGRPKEFVMNWIEKKAHSRGASPGVQVLGLLALRRRARRGAPRGNRSGQDAVQGRDDQSLRLTGGRHRGGGCRSRPSRRAVRARRHPRR